VCGLIAVNECHAAVEPHLDEWTVERPGCAVASRYGRGQSRGTHCVLVYGGGEGLGIASGPRPSHERGGVRSAILWAGQGGQHLVDRARMLHSRRKLPFSVGDDGLT